MKTKFALVLLCFCVAASVFGQLRERADIPDKYKWDLAPLYPSDAVWRTEFDKAVAEIPKMSAFKGKLGSSAASLADALEAMDAQEKNLSRLSVYASLQADQDTRDSRHHGMSQEMSQTWSRFGAETSYIEPEVLRIDAATLARFESGEPRLKPFRVMLDTIARKAAHTLGENEERLLALSGPMAAAPGETFDLLSNADLPRPKITLSDGRTVTLDQAAYNAYRALPNRGDREAVMAAFFRGTGAFSRSFGATMSGNVQRAIFYAKARKYPDDLAASLDQANIPVSVYKRLIDGINRQLPTFHRYLKLRQRILKVDQLHYYDLYAPLVASVKLQYTPEEAQANVLGALAPLGTEYTGVLRRAFAERWIDWMPTTGKDPGGYTTSAYDVHPYVLINYNGQYGDVSTVAHELGHAMHAYLSNKSQPHATSGHPIFDAEVASTFNEALLEHYMLGQIKDRDARLSILGNYLELLKGTVFRQTQFADFELQLHRMAEKGQPLTGEAIAKLYLDITRKYYGHAQGICIVDDYVANEWSMVPHFYRPFYVYQYATSMTASTALAAKVLSGGPAGAEATKRYLAFLAAGESKDPIDILKDAGVDMTTDEPLDLTMREMNSVMDEIEKLLAQ